ncbi:ABC transporter, ATP-binding protein [Candidatus Phytoplasma rubi]|uniref:ABC transporter, ATP-binding protein n=1 Tax=Candidatus Phytoplasma rubi TaxID=399025 RepID=A0ABY7BRD3_9MOLU|nr:ABC transporter ATP-binding protein [Candidatus Phytoplasma rubi]WAN63070.1 ABC transporter, ATP-binding protein [Candidatus Phytoplasma rubi]
MFRINKLNKSYIAKGGFITPALSNISLTLSDKGMCFILGKSGSGKSTFFNILTGIDTASDGKVSVAKTDITNFNQRLLDNYRNGMIGFVFQEFNLIEDMTVFENIILTNQLQNKKPDINLIYSLLEKVDLDKSFLNRKINQLSGGQRQRVGIVRALVKDPNIIFADEPTGNLDSESSSQVFDLLKDLSKEKLVIVVSHDNENAYKYADRIIEMKDGKIISDFIRKHNIKDKVQEENYLKVGQTLTKEMLNNLQKQRINQNDHFSNNFSPTDSNKIIQERHDFISFPSCLPLNFIFKNAWKSFKNKKFFLVLATIVTVFLTFIFVGCMCFYFLALKSNGFITHMKTIQRWETQTSDELNVKYNFEIPKELLLELKMKVISTGVLLLFDNIINKWVLFWIIFIPGITIWLYFHMSIKLQKGKIGILRSLGSNGINVGKILILEGFIFALIQTLFIFVLILYFASPLMFSSISIQPIQKEDINNHFINHIDELDDLICKAVKCQPEILLDKNESNYFVNFLRNLFLPFLIWHPILRVLYFILLNFSFVFFITICFISFIIYKWSTKKPIDILNNR